MVSLVAKGGSTSKPYRSTSIPRVTRWAMDSLTALIGYRLSPLDEKVASDMMNAMESVAEGYNKFVKVDGYRMAAKSGTAEVQGSDGALSSIISDYSVVIPADNPSVPWSNESL